MQKPFHPIGSKTVQAPRLERTPRRAFTLLELLVVVGIIAVLSAILFPVFAKARWRSKNAVCLSNLRQLGLVLTTYADDNEDRMPVGADTYWGDIEHLPYPGAPFLNEVLKGKVAPEVWHCPSDSGFRWWSAAFDKPILEYTPSCYVARGQSYDYNFLLVWDPDQARLAPMPVSNVRDPASIALLKDSHFAWHNQNRPRDPKLRDKNNPPAWNVLYLDGHAVHTPIPWWLNYSVDTHHWWYIDNNPRK